MKDRTWLTQLIIQPIMIVLSILIALGVDNWQKSRAKEKRLDDARAAFVNEITANKQLLCSDNNNPRHFDLLKAYEAGMKDDAVDLVAYFETDFQPPALRDSAWHMLSGSATLMELPSGFVLALTDIYRMQDSFEKRNQAFLNALRVPRADRDTPAYTKDVARSSGLFLKELVSAEEQLLRSYDHLLERFSANKAPWEDELIRQKSQVTPHSPSQP